MFFNYILNLYRFSDFLETFTPTQVEYADLLKQRKPINMELEFSLTQVPPFFLLLFHLNYRCFRMKH